MLVLVDFRTLKVVYCWLLRADLDGKVSPLDTPFRVLLDSAILFHSETYSEIENTNASFGRFLVILKGTYCQLLQADLDRKVSPLDLPFRVQ